jgi:hypothetical protein
MTRVRSSPRKMSSSPRPTTRAVKSSRPPPPGVGGHVDAGDTQLTGVRALERGDRAHERGLAGAFRAEQRGDAPRLGDEIHAGQRVDVAEPLDEAVRLDDGGHARTPHRQNSS